MNLLPPSTPSVPISRFSRRLCAGGASALLLLGAGHLEAASIAVPNFSFESQTAPSTFPFVNTFVDSWQKPAEPAYFAPVIGTPNGIPWTGTAGVFLDVNPYTNHVGNQVGYLLGFPQVALFQDYNSTPGHDFDATFTIGQTYHLTIGVFGKATLAPGSSLHLSLYYRDGSDQMVDVAYTDIIFSTSLFNQSAPLSLIDFSVNVPEVQASDAWAGKKIGIQLLSTTPLEMSTGGNWDFDNVRLEQAPEPATAGILGLGLGAMLMRRRRTSAA